MATDKKEKQSKAARKKEIEESAAEEASSELREPRWSVISFERCEANNLSYDEAAQKLKELEAENVSGLCVVTDEAAERISKKI